MNEILTLIKQTDDGKTTRDVFCGIRSIGMTEFYQASTTDFHPEIKFVLRDYLDYDNEKLVEHNGQRYSVLRTFHTGQELEIVAARASAEEGGIYE